MAQDQLEGEPEFPTDSDIDAVLYEFKGDAREAIRALLSDLATLASDYGGDVSHGYVRGWRPGWLMRRE
ncbi:MAG: hypothetical protein AVDCRST_MAG90-793 [uncultured Microvirga sp.]|uniref:Uncharacterized protein n=1 Tax=uncultured Microvirga sp. TaxID=412392 RepID=A0A6J4L031_9HYPH|nr:MAG: hypothetical protein AVDCRST_MAG90-793 [uncultured Microvirga sp.]